VPSNVYLDLTREFNEGRLRAVICSGQAVVLHRLAVMSKDGDWILREDEEALGHVLRVLDRHGARYRFGAPLDLRWMRGGWSSHFDFMAGGVRVRTDFFTRPPRVSAEELARTWSEQQNRDPPFVDARVLAEMKKTNREKDYAVIGELARLMTNPSNQLLHSRSARDLADLAARHPALIQQLAIRRPLLAHVSGDRRALQRALDDERAALVEANEQRLSRYIRAGERWAGIWPEVEREIAGRRLTDAHDLLVRRASGVLPASVEGP
jgi:hypothetical protein